MKNQIITITHSNIDKTEGPVIHYMELWNSFARKCSELFDVKGFACIQNKQNSFLIENSFPIYVVSSNYPRPLRLLIQELYFAFAIFRNRRATIYLRTGNNMSFSVLAATIFNVFLITEYNGIASMDAESNRKGGLFSAFVSFMERWAIKASAGCIAVSKGIEKHLAESGARSTICIRNGVSADFFKVDPDRRQDEKTRVVYVGTFTPWDGAKKIVDLAKNFPEVEFHLIGDGRCRKDVEERARSTKNIFFEDFIDYKLLKNEYAKYDAGIILYEFERNSMELSSLKTLEYLATGLPIFSTNVPGQEFIGHEKLGILAEENQINEKFGQFLMQLKEFKGNVDRYRSSEGQKYSWDRAAMETCEFIQELLLARV